MNQYVEKLLWMIVPLLFSAVGTLWNTVSSQQSRIQDLESKISLLVTKDNRVVPSIEAELAREKLRHDVEKYASTNRERILLLEEKIHRLEKK